MKLAKLTTKGRLTIPKTVREDLGLEKGNKVIFIKQKEGYLITGSPCERFEKESCKFVQLMIPNL